MAFSVNKENMKTYDPATLWTKTYDEVRDVFEAAASDDHVTMMTVARQGHAHQTRFRPHGEDRDPYDIHLMRVYMYAMAWAPSDMDVDRLGAVAIFHDYAEDATVDDPLREVNAVAGSTVTDDVASLTTPSYPSKKIMREHYVEDASVALHHSPISLMVKSCDLFDNTVTLPECPGGMRRGLTKKYAPVTAIAADLLEEMGGVDSTLTTALSSVGH